MGLPSQPKERGELAEALFVAKAMSLGFTVLQAFGQSRPFDCVVEYQGKLSRVQVKSSWRLGQNKLYHFPAGRWRKTFAPYKTAHVDFMAAYVAPKDAWYIIPLKVLVPRTHFAICDHAHKSKFRQYQEAWHLLT